jgi:hypothetical protein
VHWYSDVRLFEVAILPKIDCEIEIHLKIALGRGLPSGIVPACHEEIGAMGREIESSRGLG